MADKKILASAAFIAGGAFLLWKSSKGNEETTETTDATLELAKAQAEATQKPIVEQTTAETSAEDTEELDFWKWGEYIADYVLSSRGYTIDSENEIVLSADETADIKNAMELKAQADAKAEGLTMTEEQRELAMQGLNAMLKRYNVKFTEKEATEMTDAQAELLKAQAEATQKPIVNYNILTITDVNKDTYIKSFKAGYSTMDFLVLDADYDLVAFETSNNAGINLSGIKPSDSLGSFVNGQKIVLLGARGPYYNNVRLSQEGANRHEAYSFSNYIYSYMKQPNESAMAYYEFMHYNGTWFSKTY